MDKYRSFTYLLFVTYAKLGVIIFLCLLMTGAGRKRKTKVHYTNYTDPAARVSPLFHPSFSSASPFALTPVVCGKESI